LVRKRDAGHISAAVTFLALHWSPHNWRLVRMNLILEQVQSMYVHELGKAIKMFLFHVSCDSVPFPYRRAFLGLNLAYIIQSLYICPISHLRGQLRLSIFLLPRPSKLDPTTSRGAVVCFYQTAPPSPVDMTGLECVSSRICPRTSVLIAQLEHADCLVWLHEPGHELFAAYNIVAFAMPSRQSHATYHEAGSRKSPGQTFSMA
jgi:hypothetical protein